MDAPDANAVTRRSQFNLGRTLRDQIRNIAPFATLLILVGFFAIAAPSFATLGNLENILQQVSITAIIAVGLTFVILTAEIDLSVGAMANATAIVLTYFTMQPDYVNIANFPLPGTAAIALALMACCALGLITAFGVTKIGIPSFIMTLAMMQIGAGVSAVLVRGQIAYSVPPLILTLGSKAVFGIPCDHPGRRGIVADRAYYAQLHAVRALRIYGRRQPRSGRIFWRECPLDHRRRDDHFGGLLGPGRHAGRRLFWQRTAERVRHVPA